GPGEPSRLILADAVTGRVQQTLRNDAAMGAWSPDGRQIAFVHFEDGEMAGLFVMNADGSAMRRLGDDDLVLAPRWTVDGKRVVYTDTGDWEFGPGRADVHVIDADGGHARLVTKQGITGCGYIAA